MSTDARARGACTSMRARRARARTACRDGRATEVDAEGALPPSRPRVAELCAHTISPRSALRCRGAWAMHPHCSLCIHVALAWLVLLQPHTAASPADPTCAHGIRSGNACCVATCGRCGGPSCGGLPGGASDCCSGKIESSDRSCATHGPPCVISGKPPGPAPAPAPPPPPPPPGPATITVNTSTLAGNVAPEYVSFNLDTSELSNFNSSTSSTLAKLAAALSPAHLRVGGTQGDYEVYSFGTFKNFDCSRPPSPMTPYRCKTLPEEQWSGLLDFVAAANITLLFGLNDMFMRPTKTKPEHKLCGVGALSVSPSLSDSR